MRLTFRYYVMQDAVEGEKPDFIYLFIYLNEIIGAIFVKCGTFKCREPFSWLIVSG